LTEGYGIVLVESLLTGRPVVGSDVGGIREIIDDPRIGKLSPAGDPAALARAIDAVLDELEQGRYQPSTLRAHALPLTFEEVGPRLAERSRRLLT
jgi:glycosyltransferase involved in cell wall biosynthesis